MQNGSNCGKRSLWPHEKSTYNPDMHPQSGSSIVDSWQMDYNHYRPHSSIGYMSPAAFVAMSLGYESATLCLSQDRDRECNTLVETCI